MAENRPKLTVIAGRPVTVTQRESKIDAARRRYGKPFVFEKGAQFNNWNDGSPKVLTDWLQRRLWDRSILSTSSGKEGHE